MHIVAPLTAVKADRNTRLLFKGARSQLETLSPKMVSIEFPEEKRYYLFNPSKPELNPSAQRCLTRFLNGGFCFLNRAFR
jgi:hypothetical protein